MAAERRGTPGVALRQKRSNFRWVLAIFAMLMTFMSYLDRVNLSVTAPAIMKELHFTKVHIGTLQTVFFLCYALFQIPSGTLTEYFGHRKIVPLALAWWSVFTSLTAFCSRFSTWMVIRGLFGMGEAPIYPGLNAAFSNWFPKRERGTAVGLMLLGSKFGPMVGIPCATVIMLYWGWRAVFVVFGAVGLVIALIYYLMLRTYPHESRFVNEAELEHIADGQVASDTTKLMPPWKDLFRSSQFWALGGQFAMVDYIQYVFIAWLPVYLLEAHHFSLKQMGFAAALPELGFAVGNLLCGVISDRLIAKKIVGSKARAWFGAAGLLLCCLALYLTAVSEDQMDDRNLAELRALLPGLSDELLVDNLYGHFGRQVYGNHNRMDEFLRQHHRRRRPHDHRVDRNPVRMACGHTRDRLGWYHWRNLLALC